MKTLATQVGATAVGVALGVILAKLIGKMFPSL